MDGHFRPYTYFAYIQLELVGLFIMPYPVEIEPCLLVYYAYLLKETEEMHVPASLG